jgi:hypothetical protein
MKLLEPPLAKHAPSQHPRLPPGLPAGCEIQGVDFVTGESAAKSVLLEFQEPFSCRAILTTGLAASTHAPTEEKAHDLELLFVPSSSDQEDPELLGNVWNWLEPGIQPDRRQAHLITLQGTRILWTPGRAGIMAPADRLDGLRLALVEFAFLDGELRKIEQSLARDWPMLEADAPLAFHFDDKAASRREELGTRFQHVLGLRSRLARITPLIYRPPLHPPTLAGQLGERLKERTRLAERIEFLSDQLEVFERVYEMCGQRSSDAALNNRSTTLEWVIIVLLAAECIILLIDLMNKLGK